ncbi:head decoration protein [uncultured Devosia sp.]|uniref:head decoration protein n=1 Tax=uncultured Devosia sp. TaxID=211434 RepID=UPI00260E9D3E|nr:head decoration protein [uncultured Devosia sp.]
MPPRSFSINSPKLQTSFLKFELNPDFNREQGVLMAGDGASRAVVIGQPLGLGDGDDPEASAVAGNVGDGTITLADPALGAGVVPGIYRLVCATEAANGGTFHVFDPAGANIGTATVGVAFDGVIKFTIADGAEDFDIGDAFEVLVHPGTKLKEWDPEAVDGSQVFDSFAIMPATAPDGTDVSILTLARGPAIVASDGLALPDDITADQRAALYAATEAKGIIIRLS